MSKTWTNTNMD